MRAATQGRGKGRVRMWSWLEPGSCYSCWERWNVNRNHTRVGPTVGKGFGLLSYSGWASAGLVYVCELLGQEAVIVPRTLLWKRAAVSS